MESVRRSDAVYLDSICTCRTCNHKLTKNCIEASCTCCTEANHSMVLDGIEGFAPPNKKEKGAQERNNAGSQKRPQ